MVLFKVGRGVEVRSKKGFTLVELITALVVLVIIVGISVPLVVNVRKNILNNQFDNVKVRIETAAVKFAADTQIRTVSVEKLIEEGYLTADDDGNIYNPLDNTSLNCRVVEVNLDNNGTYDATLINNGEFVNGACSEYDIKVESLIKISCYSENGNEDEIKSCEKAFEDSDKKWYKGSVLLSIDDKVTKNITDYRWQGLTGETGNEDSLVVTADSVISTSFNLSLTYEDGTSENSRVDLKIDNEKPSIIDIVKDDNWSNEKKTITINASDNNGSGIDGYYVGESNTCDGEFTDKNEFNLETGSYYACVKDKVGNISDAESFEVANIDKIAPVAKCLDNACFLTDSEVKGITYYSNLARKIVFEDNEGGVASVKYCFTNSDTCTPDKKATVKPGSLSEAIISYESNKKAMRVCVKALDNVGNESEVICDLPFLVDATKPKSVTATKNVKLLRNSCAWSSSSGMSCSSKSLKSLNSSEISVSAQDLESDIAKIICRYGTSNSNLDKSVEAKNDICDLGPISSGKTYYVVADAYNNANLISSSSLLSFTAKVTMSDAYTEICGSDEYCNSPLYVSYNGKRFIVYRNKDGYKAIYNSIVKDANYLQSACCNNKQCTYSGSKFTNGYTCAYLNGTFLNSLPNYSDKLINSTWNTGLTSGNSARAETAYVGLMDYVELDKTQNKSWIHSETGGRYFWLLTPSSQWRYIHNYIASCSSSKCNLSTEVVNKKSGVRPIIVFKGSIVFTSGDGSFENPYVV